VHIYLGWNLILSLNFFVDDILQCMKEILFRLARSEMSGKFIGYAFENMTRLMPLDRIEESEKIIVFRHPVPQWEQHLLAVPKKNLRSFESLDFTNQGHVEYLRDLLKCIQSAAITTGLNTYAVLMNGGAYQDVPQLHFHIISGKKKEDHSDPIYPLYKDSLKGKTIVDDEYVEVRKSSKPMREVHQVIFPKNIMGTIQTIDLDNDDIFEKIKAMFEKGQEFIKDSNLDKYTFLTVQQENVSNLPFSLHVISGSSIY